MVSTLRKFFPTKRFLKNMTKFETIIVETVHNKKILKLGRINFVRFSKKLQYIWKT